jgi:hypothetical protein
MGKTLLELFKGSPQDKQVKAERETFLEQETSGIRISSLVEVNNPIIYGNEATRIALRSTPSLETMKSNAAGGDAGGGLIGGAINKARDFVNDTLGIPKGLIPSTIADKIIELRASKTPDNLETSKLESANSQTPITKDGYGPNGSLVGKFLKQSGGGNPTTIGKQALGSGIGVAKDKLRGALFGEGQTPGQNKPVSVEYTNSDRTYSDTNKSKKIKSEEGVRTDLQGTKLDLSLVSPIYGTQRKETIGRFGKSEYAFQQINDANGNPIWNQSQSNYDIKNRYSSYTDSEGAIKDTPIQENSLEKKYGITSKSDNLNKLSITDIEKFTIDEYGNLKNGEEVVGSDFIPFNIGKRGQTKIPFRATVNGITENVSPTWNSNKFLGNPFNFYTYSGIERSVSFNFTIFCLSPTELLNNWEKIQFLTKLTYPSINTNNLVNPPIIQFKLGDVYHDKDGFIESLTYTVPDNSNWETDGKIGYLPKIIQVAIGIKFIETPASMINLYGYKLSKEAQKANKEALENRGNFSENERINSNGTTNRVESVATDSRGIVKLPTTTINDNKPAVLKGLGGLKTRISTPSLKEMGQLPAITNQSAAADNLKGKTPLEASKEVQNKNGLTEAQSVALTRAQQFDSKITLVPRTSIPPMFKIINELPGDVFMKSPANEEYSEDSYAILKTDGTHKELIQIRTRYQKSIGL